jgi:regulator of protease activity HflC (stomatin/prohibitin superfamily)
MTLKDNENQIKISTAKAEAENKLILADAEARAKIKIGEAEIYIQEKQNNMPNAALRIVTEGQVEALRGVAKIIYTDQQSMLLKPYLAIPDGGVISNKQK